MMTDNTYNGWHNYHTWNVALYIENEYDLYRMALRYRTYDKLLPYLKAMCGDLTPDGVSWTDPTLDKDELNEMLADL